MKSVYSLIIILLYLRRKVSIRYFFFHTSKTDNTGRALYYMCNCTLKCEPVHVFMYSQWHSTNEHQPTSECPPYIHDGRVFDMTI